MQVLVLGASDGSIALSVKFIVLSVGKTHVGEMLVERKALVGCESPDQSSYGGNNVEVAYH